MIAISFHDVFLLNNNFKIGATVVLTTIGLALVVLGYIIAASTKDIF